MSERIAFIRKYWYYGCNLLCLISHILGERTVDSMKKKWVIPVIAVALAAVAVVIMVAHLSGRQEPSGNPDEPMYSAGRYIRTENGMDLIILQGSPVVMSGEDSLFEGLHTGDEIRICHG